MAYGPTPMQNPLDAIENLMFRDPQLISGVLDAIADGIVWVDGQGNIQGCNAAFANWVEQPRETLLHLPLTQVLGLDLPSKPLPWRSTTYKCRIPLLSDTGEPCLIRRSQHYQWVEAAWSFLPSLPDGLVLVLRNVQPTEQFLHDPLTGLVNRSFVMNWLNDLVERSKLQPGLIATVLFMDVDRFKVINDGLGHHVGDEVLIAIAQRLKRCLHPNDILARLGGDEFCILRLKHEPDEDVIPLAEKLQTSMQHPFHTENHPIFVTFSVGVVASTAGYEHASDIVRDADNAMYRAKAKGRGSYEVFQPDMHTRVMAQLQLENDLRQAIEEQQFILHYQPVISLRNKRLLGFEALVRWHHPERGLVSPGDFIPLAEETGLIVPLGWWVLREACRQLKLWQTQFNLGASVFISVNISGRQFTQPDLIEQIQHALNDTALKPCCLKLEITESMLMDRVDSVIALLDRIKSLGVQISVDDFGTGYSSLGYLNRFPIDTLKIDRSFVEDVECDPEKLEIVKTIVMLAWNLGMDVIAEGVENQKQLHQLKALQCESGQGYFFSKPMDASAAEVFLTDITQPQPPSE